jgi:allantoate deiminase
MPATIHQNLQTLTRFSDEAENLTRLTLSPSHKLAFKWLKDKFQAAGMAVSSDGLGSLIGLYGGESERELIIGSHIDTVKNAGLYDGNLGVLLGLNIVETLKSKNERLPFALKIVAFADEEGVRFPSALSTSRLMAGGFNEKLLDECDENGISRAQALAEFGENTKAITPNDISKAIGYLEVHIEQGPVLEAENLSLGVVSAINGATRGRITLTGMAGHAGTLPMAMRQDALMCFAEIALAIEARAKAEPDLVATIGTLNIPHAAVNVVPGAVSFSFDVRAPQDDAREKAVQDILVLTQNIAKKRGIQAETLVSYTAPAAPSDTRLMNYLTAAMAQNACPQKILPSGAGHDAMAFKGKVPHAMLFVRSKAGISHHPDEFTSEQDIDMAAKVLMQAVLNLAQSEGLEK